MAYEYIGGLVVPTALLLASIFSKKLVRGPGWEPSDFYLGVELTLGAFTTGLMHLFDIWKSMRQAVRTVPNASNVPTGSPALSTDALVNNFFYAATFLTATLLMFLLVLSLHQNWEKKEQSPDKFLKLGVFANIIGFGLMVVFFLVVKGVH